MARDEKGHEERTEASIFDGDVFREIYHSVNDAIFVHDANTGAILDVNETACDMYGYTREELRRLTVGDLSEGNEPYTQEAAVERMQAAAAGEPQVFDWRAVNRDGYPFWVEVNMRNANAADRSLVLVIVREVTERKVREERLQASEARYRSFMEDVLDTSNVATFILDSDFEVVWINEATEEFFGVERAELVGADKRTQIDAWIKDIFEDADRFAETVLATYDDNSYVENFECHVLGDDTREGRWLEHWSRPIEEGHFEGGRIEHYQDITQLKHTQQALERKNEQLGVLN